MQLGPAEAEQGRGSGSGCLLLLPGRTKRMKPVIRVRASRGEAGGGSGPSRNGNWGVFRFLGIPHPPPAPLPSASTPRPARIPAPGGTGSWAGPRARLHRSAKTRSANRAAGAGTWSRGARCCWRGVLAPGRLCFFAKRNQIRSWPVVGHPVGRRRFPDWSVPRFPCHPWRGLRNATGSACCTSGFGGDVEKLLRGLCDAQHSRRLKCPCVYEALSRARMQMVL